MNFKDKIFYSLANTICPKAVNNFKQDCIQEAQKNVSEELERMETRMKMYHKKEEFLEKENQQLKRVFNIKEAQKNKDLEKNNLQENDYSKLFD